MTKTISVLLLLCSLNISTQNINLNQGLPLDTTVKKGVLPNGLTYYIKNTDVTKDVASYYIIQNVGSVLENDDQRGLAHFLEHMAFNGTENFPGKGVLNTMEKQGLVFGRDINAYTSFDETVYNINNIPTTPELIDTGLKILRDWSNYLLLTEEEIDAERGVIKEEWRTRQSGGMRILKQSLPTMFNNSKYAKRMPIGQMDIIDNFEYKALRDFYHDWYRTDLQAIAIIGDIDAEDIEQKIIHLFANIPAIENPKERFIVDIPDNDNLLYSLALDEEVTTASITFGIRHPKSSNYKTVADLKNSLLNNMVTNMLSTRLSEITQKPKAPFLGVRIAYSKNSRSTNVFSARISPKPNQQQEAFKVLLEEINRAVKFGFTEEEINRTIIQFKKYYENAISKQNDKSHNAIVAAIKQNYLDNAVITDIEKEYEIVKYICKELNNEEVHHRIKELYNAKNRYLLVTGVQDEKNLLKEAALKIINAVETSNSLVPYTDNFKGKTLTTGINMNAGHIVSESANDSLKSTTFILSNNIKLHYKFVDKNANDVQLVAVSDGGTSLLEDSYLPSANIMANVIQYSGLGNYSATDLPKVLAGKTARTNVNLSGLSEQITGTSVTKDVETMLQMVYLRFVKPRFDKDGYKVIMQNVKNYKIRRRENISEKMKDSLTVTLYGNNHPKHRLFNDAFINDISFDKIKAIYSSRFGNAADFEFFIVGDIKKDVLKPLIEKYIASIPTNSFKEEWKDNSTSWRDKTIDKDIYLKMEDPKTSVRITFKNEYEYSLKNAFIASALADVLQLRYTETLRENEGGTYGARVSASVSKRPKQQASISVSFDCNPEKAEALITIVHQEIEKIVNGKIEQSDLDKTLTNYVKERKQQKDYNRYDMSLLTQFYREGYNMNNPKNFETIISEITKEDLQNFTKNVLNNAESFEIVFKPLE
ncbi:pitrilysin family protein [uncultured Polaribacter sp.]|uniref:M16 family metallopeptidase n=1 Tax=uncultured Polaribacter sp. TaxID=174711 RepID=UPI00260B5AAB|nr:insulinase family protein [uncultured Polaribacter sp.]